MTMMMMIMGRNSRRKKKTSAEHLSFQMKLLCFICICIEGGGVIAIASSSSKMLKPGGNICG